MQLAICQFRGPLPQVRLKGDSMKSLPKVVNNIYSLATSENSNLEKQELVRILGSSLQHFSAGLIKEDLDSYLANIFWAPTVCQALC